MKKHNFKTERFILQVGNEAIHVNGIKDKESRSSNRSQQYYSFVIRSKRKRGKPMLKC